jgi:hypothetical protein
MVNQEAQHYTWGSSPRLIQDVQAWVDDPSMNFGWLIMGDESTNRTATRYDSREHPDSENHPVLTIEFTPPPQNAVSSWYLYK